MTIVGGNYNDSITLDIEKGQTIFLYFELVYSNGFGSFSGTGDFEIQGSSIDISFNTKSPASTTTGHFAFEVLDKALSKITGEIGDSTITSVTITIYQFSVSEEITGATSTETADIDIISSDQLTMFVSNVTGDFTIGERIDGTNAASILKTQETVFKTSALGIIEPSPGSVLSGLISGETADVVSTDGIYITVENVSSGEELYIDGSPSGVKLRYLETLNKLTFEEFTVSNTLTGGTSTDEGIISSLSGDQIVVTGDEAFEDDELISDGTQTARIKSRVVVSSGISILESEFLSKKEQGSLTDGYGSLNFITSGNKIRGLTSNSNLKVKANDIFDFYKVRYGCGWAVVDSKVVLERNENFYQDVEIAQLDTSTTQVSNPATRKINMDIVFNELECGYSKYSKENEDGSIDGFNTRRSYLSPVVKEKKKLSLITNLVTDSAELERVRRLKIKQDESDQSDNEIFIIKCQRFNSENPFVDENYDSASGVGTSSANAQITLVGFYLKGQTDNATTITVTAGDLIGITNETFGIDAISYDAENNSTIIDVSESLPSGTLFSNSYSFYFDIDIFLPERIEAFNNVSGLDDKYSEYNIDHAPTNFLIQNWQIYGASLSQKPVTKNIKFTTGVNTVSLSKQYKEATGSKTTAQIVEDQDFLLSSLNYYNPPIIKTWQWEIVAYCPYSVWKDIRLALLGLSDNSDNWGYLTFTDNFGNLVKIFPKQIKREEKEERLTIIGWEKEVPTPPQTFYLLKEDGDRFELEDGSGFIELEH